MTIGISRKIQLERFGGQRYETMEVWLESETLNATQLAKELDQMIADYITTLPNRETLFTKAKEGQPPF